jgi:hypothetical protein
MRLQTKSKRGIAMPRRAIALSRERLKWAERLHAGTSREQQRNVFTDLGLPNSGQELLKAKLRCRSAS